MVFKHLFLKNPILANHKTRRDHKTSNIIIIIIFLKSPHLFFQDGLMFLTQLVCFTAKVVSLGLQLFVQSELMFIHLRLEFVLQSQQLFLVLPPHALVPGHLLPQS